MFIRNFNGYLINLDKINKINIEISESICKVVAFTDENKEEIYRSNKIDDCNNYLSNLSRKIAVNHEVWEI